MTARRARFAAEPDGVELGTIRVCPDCVPPLRVQAGEWGWQAHRYTLHGEGDDPGPHPPPATGRPAGPTPWTDQDRAEFHRRNWAQRRRRYASAAGARPSTGSR